MNYNLFNYTAITINDIKEVENFYINILCLEIKKQNLISKDLADQIFNVSKLIEVITLGKNDFNLELFIDNKCKNNNLNHISINVINREYLIKKACENNFPCIIFNHDSINMIFIRDKSNNLFEIKQK